jgi:hypothetical protein
MDVEVDHQNSFENGIEQCNYEVKYLRYLFSMNTVYNKVKNNKISTLMKNDLLVCSILKNHGVYVMTIFLKRNVFLQIKLNSFAWKCPLLLEEKKMSSCEFLDL